MFTDEMFLLVMIVSGFSLFFCLGTNLYFVGQATGRATAPASRHLNWAWGLSISSLLIPYTWTIATGILVWRRYKKWAFREDSADATLERWTRITLTWTAIQYVVTLCFILAWLLEPQGSP